MSNIKTVKLIDRNGVVFGVNQEGGDILTRAKMFGNTGASLQIPRLDPGTLALKTASHAESEAHEGHSFKVDAYEADFDKADEIGILFTTPNTPSRLHCIPLVYASSAALFQICEAPTLDPNNYPSSFYTLINRNRNSGITSEVLSVRAVPVINQTSIKVVADGNPVSADGTVIHSEVIGAGKKGGGGGMRDTDEYILKLNTTYYFRLAGMTNGADNAIASIHVNWFEHIALE